MEKELLEKLITYSFKLIARRPQSTYELSTKLFRYLRKHKIQEPELYRDEVLDYLTRKNFINDKQFARWFVEQRTLLKPRSKRGVAFELRQKGIEQSVIENVLKEYDETAALKTIIAKKKQHNTTEELKQYLLQQGFPYDLIIKYVNRKP